MNNSQILTPDDEARARLRRSIYAILVTLSVGAMLGRVLALNSVDVIKLEDRLNADRVKKNESKLQLQRPFLSANDRSRWLTMRALVEKGTYAIDQYVTDPETHPSWDTIDMVVHQDRTGQPHCYSSKPPLLSTVYAGIYWVIHQVTGKTLGTNPYEIGRSIIVAVNILPMMAYFFVLASLLDRYGRTDWGRIFVLAAAAFGTYLTTFAVAINNHLPAAVCAIITLYTVCRIWYDGQRHWKFFAWSGFFAAATVACELPALSLFAVVAAGLLWKAPRQTLLAFVPAALVVAVPYFMTNWLAHGTLRPAYSFREYTRVEGQDPNTLAGAFEGTITVDSGKTVTIRGNENNWYDYEYTRTDRKPNNPVQSYWRNPSGFDIGEASRGNYAFHLLVGHHGIFSLTPLWLLVIPGVLLLGWSKDYRLRDLAIMTIILTLVCISFYIMRPKIERNYGGTSSAFRWIFWLSPLWLVAILPAADRLSAWRWGRAVGCFLLAVSVMSAAYPIWNPWIHPWLAVFWQYMGWG
ncbi:MAG: hypothetical protein IT427_01240 [Pirellulales bacterium]|nr:hypothetical protein [Pirellulales bacterium]